MSEQQFGWNYFENEVVIRDKQDKKRMIVIVFSNFMCIPYNRKSFDELVDLLNEQQATISQLEAENDNMNLFIKQTIEPLLWNCVFELNTIETMSQIELAEKIENEIIPFIQDFKYSQYESPEEEKQDKSE